MEKISIYLKNQAKEKEGIHQLAQDTELGHLIEIIEEEPSKEPIVSSASMGPAEIQQLADAAKGLLGAESIVNFAVGLVAERVLNETWKGFKSLVKFFSVNNKKKGNKIGVKTSIQRDLQGKKYDYEFICDDIPEAELPNALLKMNSAIDNLHIVLGDNYFETIRRVMFMYEPVLGWKVKAIEQFKMNK